MDDTETKSEEPKLDKKAEFFKMMLGIGVGWLAKELAEGGFMWVVNRHKDEPPKITE